MFNGIFSSYFPIHSFGIVSNCTSLLTFCTHTLWYSQVVVFMVWAFCEFRNQEPGDERPTCWTQTASQCLRPTFQLWQYIHRPIIEDHLTVLKHHSTWHHTIIAPWAKIKAIFLCGEGCVDFSSSRSRDNKRVIRSYLLPLNTAQQLKISFNQF